MTLLLQNLTYQNKKIDILIKNGKIKKIDQEINIDTNKTIDCKGGLLIQPFNDPHIHIDSALTAGEPTYNQSGSLFEGIEIWRKRKKQLDKKDFIKRTNLLFAKYVEHGVHNIRAHIDITNDNIEIIKWANEQKEIWKNKLNIQLVAFPQDGILTKEHFKNNLKQAIEYGIDVVGGIPHYEISKQHGYESIDYLLQVAKENNLLVDMHCDEIDDPNSQFLEYLAAKTYQMNMQSKVTASHTTAFARYNNAYVRKLWNILIKAKMNFIANPLVNVHLGGRFDTNNPGRGITRVKEILENKLNVAYGHDDVQDPWYPLGECNMLQVLFMGIHLNHLTGYKEIENSIDLITKNSSKLMNLPDWKLQEKEEANFIVMHQNNIIDVISKIDQVQLSIKSGKVIYG